MSTEGETTTPSKLTVDPESGQNNGVRTTLSFTQCVDVVVSTGWINHLS